MSRSIQIEVIVPSPLRLDFVGNNGYTLVSDSCGFVFEHELVPANGVETTMLDLEWDQETFVRVSTTTMYLHKWPGTPRMEYGLATRYLWKLEPFDCAYGIRRYVFVVLLHYPFQKMKGCSNRLWVDNLLIYH